MQTGTFCPALPEHDVVEQRAEIPSYAWRVWHVHILQAEVVHPSNLHELLQGPEAGEVAYGVIVQLRILKLSHGMENRLLQLFPAVKQKESYFLNALSSLGWFMALQCCADHLT